MRKSIDNHQKGRQQGSSTGREAYKSNSQDFYRHPGQGMRGMQGGQHEAASDERRKYTRPANER